MFRQAQPDDLSPDTARALVLNQRWRPLLMIALAFAYQSNIVHRFGRDNGDWQYKTMSIEANIKENIQRDKVELPRKATALKISDRSLAYQHSSDEKFSFMVYTGSGRFPWMKSVTPLPGNLAGWFTYQDSTWDSDIIQDSFSLALACFEICFPANLVSSPLLFSFFFPPSLQLFPSHPHPSLLP